jgi:hypothetical protein
MAHLQTAVHRDIHLDLTTITVPGHLSQDHAEALRRLLDECTAECPCVVAVDLTGAGHLTTQAAKAITHATTTHPGSPAVDLLAYGPAESLEMLASVPVYTTKAEAHAAARDHRERHPTTRLPFDRSVDSPAAARRAVRNACAAWALDHVAADAELIMSELVTNAIRHTNGAGEAAISLRRPYVVLAVKDEDPRPPITSTAPFSENQLPNGRGLGLVELLGSSWGHRVHHQGNAKVVWAAVAF